MKAANPWENIPVMTEAEIEALERRGRIPYLGESDRRMTAESTGLGGGMPARVDFHLDGSVPEERK